MKSDSLGKAHAVRLWRASKDVEVLLQTEITDEDAESLTPGF